MRKILLFGLLLLLGMVYGCTTIETNTCGSGYHFEGDTCVLDEITTTGCGSGYHLEGDSCVIDTTTVTGCSESELEVGDECIHLTAAQWLVYDAIEGTVSLDNLTITIEITEGEVTTNALIKLDESTYLYEDVNQTVTVIESDETCTAFIEAFGNVESSNIQCFEPAILFFRNFTYDMFFLEDMVFHLDESAYSLLDNFVNSFENATIDDFILSISNNQIIAMELYITADEVPLQILLEIIDVNQTVIEIPETE